MGLADKLGWASAALGLPMLFVPGRLLRAIGVRDDRQARLVTAGLGVRELAAAMTILGMRHRRIGAWSRVGGDTLDLTLLAFAFRTRRENPSRLLSASAFVTAILSVDLFAALRLSHAEGVDVADGSESSGLGVPEQEDVGPAHVRTAITVRGSEEEVRARFRAFPWTTLDPVALQESGELRFVPAPGGRGVEIHVDHDPSIRGGGAGVAALKLTSRSPDQKINDELRRFKSLVETGVDVSSDKTPEGPSARRQMLQRPGQPVGGTA